jgi:hypothetical protein
MIPGVEAVPQRRSQESEVRRQKTRMVSSGDSPQVLVILGVAQGEVPIARFQ